MPQLNHFMNHQLKPFNTMDLLPKAFRTRWCNSSSHLHTWWTVHNAKVVPLHIYLYLTLNAQSILPHAGNKEFRCYETKIVESEKAGSHQKSNPGHLAWVTSALPLRHDSRTTINPHNPLHVPGLLTLIFLHASPWKWSLHYIIVM